MSETGNSEKDKSRKRRYLTSGGLPLTNQSDINTSDIEDLQSVTASTTDNIIEEPRRPKKLCPYSKVRREYEKFVSTVISKTNHQRDLRTQLELAAQQAQSDDSDDEPSSRRLRRDDLAPAHKSKSSSNSALALDEHLKSLNIGEHQEIIHALPMISASSNSDVAADMDPPGTQPEAPCTTSQDNNEIAIQLQRYHDQRVRANNSAVHTVDSSPERNYIPLPSTSASASSTINLPPFETESTSIEETNADEYQHPTGPDVLLAGFQDLNNFASTSNFDENYVLIELIQGEDSDDSVDNISVGDEEHQQQPSLQQRVPERLLESSDDEEYQQMVQDIENCYIDGDNRWHNRTSRLNRVPIVTGRASSPRSSPWRRQRTHHGTRGRTMPHPEPYRVAPYAMTYDELFPNVYYLLGTDELFYPVHVNEQPTFLEFEQLVFGIPAESPPIPPYPGVGVAIQNIGWGPWARNRAESPDLPIEEGLSTASNTLPLNTSQSRRIRSVSTESLPILMDYHMNMALGDESNESQEGAHAAPSADTNVDTHTNLTRSTSIPDLNVIGICPICTQGLHKKEVASTYCGHLFCMYCIRRAILINGKRCPTCRRPLTGQCYHKVYF